MSTPRTDEREKTYWETPTSHVDDVWEFARQLERENAALRDALVQAGVTEKRLKEHADRVNNANDQLIVEILPLYEDKARLDWLAVSETWFDVPANEGFTPQSFRAAIDAARKEAQP